jgi:hypothetical protein
VSPSLSCPGHLCRRIADDDTERRVNANRPTELRHRRNRCSAMVRRHCRRMLGGNARWRDVEQVPDGCRVRRQGRLTNPFHSHDAEVITSHTFSC